MKCADCRREQCSIAHAMGISQLENGLVVVEEGLVKERLLLQSSRVLEVQRPAPTRYHVIGRAFQGC